nr:serine/threonine-protein kinase 10 [Vanessa tameamea]
MNLQNESTIKSVEKFSKIQSLSQKKQHYLPPTSEDNQSIDDEIALFLKQSSDSKVNLAIENDVDFKLGVKEKPKLQENTIYTRKVRSIHSHSLDVDSNKNLIKSVCVEKEIKTNDVLKNSTNDCIVKNIEQKNVMNNNNSAPPLNEVKRDLQSLLIMMAINSDMDDNAESDDFLGQKKILEEDSSKYITQDKTSNQLESPYNFQSQDLVKFLHVSSVRKKLSYHEKYISKKYIRKWKLYVSNRKENLALKQRQETLNNFFDKLSRKKNNAINEMESAAKSKFSVRDYNTYQQRYKVQKHIIALQKNKLEEQNKVIEQLKYNKIVECSRNSVDEMREDIRKTYFEIDKHLKPKIKCLTNELKIKEFEEPALVLHCLKVPQFLQRMERRAREREEKHAMIRERRKQIEEERIKQKQQAELAKLEIDKEEKMKRIKELRDKRKKERIETIRKKQHVEKLRALIVMADLHYEKYLVIKYGIRPLRRLIDIKHDNIEKAKAHYRFQLLRNVFLNWMWYTEDMWFDRNYKADDFNRKNILREAFTGFKKNHHEYVLKKQVAEDYYDLYVTKVVFRKFVQGIDVVKKEFELKWKKAVTYYNSNILFKTFTCWRTLPALNALKREQDARKLRWREKVLLVVPDYIPPED